MSNYVSLIRIEAPHFVAGVEVKDGVVVKAAPIVRYMIGWTQRRVIDYAESKRWFHSGEPVSKPCRHAHITGLNWPDGGWVDYCNDCGKSRWCWEQEDGEWQEKGDINKLKQLSKEVEDGLKAFC